MAEEKDDPFIGRTIARKYVVESLIGRGGIATVYRARQNPLNRPVAIKFLHRNFLDDPTFAARFKREAKAVSAVVHPNLVQVYDFGEEADGHLYIAMEHIDGENLRQLLARESPLSDATIVDILSQALAGLAVAHEHGAVHRDIKPDNIVLARGRDDEGVEKTVVKICDFGFVKMVTITDEQMQNPGRKSTTLTTRGTLVGTPPYMSPEQANDSELDARSDLYSMGIVMYQMLTGRVPFESKNLVNLLMQHLEDQPTPPSKLRKGVNPALEAVCLKALQKKPADRFASAREMRNELRAALQLKDGNSSRPPPDPSAKSVTVRPPRSTATTTIAPAAAASYLPIILGVIIAIVGIVAALILRK